MFKTLFFFLIRRDGAPNGGWGVVAGKHQGKVIEVCLLGRPIDTIHARTGLFIDLMQFSGPGWIYPPFPTNSTGGKNQTITYPGGYVSYFFGYGQEFVDRLKFAIQCPPQ